MSINSNYLDLTNSVWTTTEFQNHNLTVADGKIIVSPEVKDGSIQNGWFGKVLQGAKHWTVGDGPSSIYTVSEGIDQLAQQQLNQEYQHSIAELKAPHSLEERISIIQNTIKHLGNLKQNLTNHDAVVEEYNKSFYTSVVVCASHKKIIDAVGEVLTELNIQESSLESEKNKATIQEFVDLLSELQINLNNGMLMTKDVLLRSYPRILRHVKKAGLEDQPKMLNTLHTLLNKSYVNCLIATVKQDQIPLPQSLQMVLSKLGFKEGEMQEKILEGKSKLILLLESYRDDENSLLLHSNEFAGNIQNDFIELAANSLASSHEVALKPLIRELYLFEVDTRKKMQQIEQMMQKGFEETIEIMPTETEEQQREKQILKDTWRLYKFPDFLPEILNQLIGDMDFDQSLLSTIQQNKNAWNNERIFGLYITKMNEVMKGFILEAKLLAHIPTWEEKNAHAQRFSFNQSSWGDQEIFGEGCCKAINYRWIKHLLQRPAARVNSADDFLDYKKALRAGDGSGVTIQDRIAQATYSLEYLALDIGGGIGPTILKRDRLTYNLLESEQFSIGELIDSLYNDHYRELISDPGGGIVDIEIAKYDEKINKYSGRHAIGMQIEPTRSLFRFWDVNHGFYQYSSLDELKVAFTGFIEAYYEGYNSFRAGQYLRS